MSVTIKKLIEMLEKQPDKEKLVCVSEEGIRMFDMYGILTPEHIETGHANDFIVLLGEGVSILNLDGGEQV